MARPIKMHEDTLFKVMKKSLKPIESSVIGIHKALAKQSVEKRIEGERFEKVKLKNDLQQTNILSSIAKLLEQQESPPAGESAEKIKGESTGWFGKTIVAIKIATAALLIYFADVIAGLQLFWDGFKAIFKLGPKEGPSKFKITYDKWMAKWDDLIKTVKESKLVTGMKTKWNSMLVAMRAPFTPLLEFIDDITGGAEAKGKKPGKIMEGLKRTKNFIKLGLKSFLLKFAPWLFKFVGIIDSFWDMAKHEDKEGDNIFKKINERFFTFRETFTTWFVDDMIFGTIGFITDAFKTLFGDKKLFDETTDSNLKERFNKWRNEFEDILYDWWTKTSNAINSFFLNSLKKLDPRTWFGGGEDGDTPSTPGEKPKKLSPSKPNTTLTPDQLNAPGSESIGKNTTEDDKPGFFGKLWGGFKKDLSQSFSKKSTTPHKTIKDDGGTTNMGGVEWNKIHDDGRKGVEAAIWSVYGKYGKTPTFVSGLRDKDHRLYNPSSQHAYGMAFDLRSKDLGNSLEPIKNELAAGFANAGLFFQHEVAGQKNTTGTKATGDHFHIHKAAKGWHGYVDQLTGFIAGEAGRERVDIEPASSPTGKMNNLNRLQTERAMPTGSGASPTNVIQVSNNTTNGQSTVLFPQLVRSRPYAGQYV